MAEDDRGNGAPTLNRRRFVQGAGLLAGGVALGLPGLLGARGGLDSPVFTLGVGSGDPSAHGVVLWTRLAPDPLNGGGMRPRPERVGWEVALDPDMRYVVREGRAVAHPRDGHALRVLVQGLKPGTTYWYQFKWKGERSRVGRTRTFPAYFQQPEALRVGVVSCQNYQQGFYAAYRDMVRGVDAGRDLDFVMHTGDYIYESGLDLDAPAARRHDGPEIFSVEDYRNRYALYRLDPDLQDAHALFPFVVTWDDHEVDNNYAGLVPEDDQTREAFRQRRANAYRVYAESMALRPPRRARGPFLHLFRRLHFGRLASFSVLDTRQFRTDQPCADGLQFLAACPEILDPNATLLGERQEQWLFRGLRQSRATWNVMAQQVMMMQWDLGAAAGTTDFFNVDAWDGYQVARNRIMAFLAEEQPANPVVLTGDIHSSWAAELKRDFDDPASATVGAEFVATGISSSFGDENVPLVQATLPSNPHIRFFDGLHRGYLRCEVTPELWATEYRAVERVPDPVLTVPSADVPAFTLARFGVRAGEPGVVAL